VGTDRQQGGASQAGRLVVMATWLWGWMVDGMAAFGTILIVVLMAIIFSDVVARNLLGASLPVIAELSALTLVMIVYLQLGAAIRHSRLSRAEIIIAALHARSPRAAAVLEASFALVGAAMLAIVAWSTLSILEADLVRGRYIGVTGVLIVPVWPFRLVILFGIAVAAVQCVAQIVTAFRPEPAEDGEAT
jgi:TRAP-type mannitol/chloroaromatic compound transport system permease small subunit